MPLSRVKIAALLGLVLVASSAVMLRQACAQSVETPSDLAGVRVAIYYGDESASRDSRKSLELMFEYMNATADLLTAHDIIDGGLSGYHMVVIPGGWAGTYNSELGTSGLGEIRRFVRDGGAFFGVCAGAYFACDRIVWEGSTIYYALDLFDGVGIGPVEEIAEWPNYAMGEFILDTDDCMYIQLAASNSNMSVLYYGGPYFSPDNSSEIDVIATYEVNGAPAMIAFPYDDGRVFLSGPHPEWEEDSDRDAVAWYDVFDDQGSEWDLMLQISLWLVEMVRPDMNNGSPLTLEPVIAAIVVLVLVAVVLAYRISRPH